LSFGLSARAEDRFRKASLPADVAQARICILLCLAPLCAFAVNDYAFFGLTWPFYGLQALRLAVLIHTGLLLRWLPRATSYRSYDRAELAWGLVFAAFTLTIAATRPEAFIAHAIVVVVAVFLTLLAVPNRFGYQLGISLVYVAGEALVMAPSLGSARQGTVTVLISLLLATAAAVATSSVLHRWRRREFRAREREHKARAEAQRQLAERQRSEQDWERTFNSVPDLIAMLDKRHRIKRVNRAMAQRLGREPQECVGLRCYEAVHGLPAPPAFCPHARTMRDGQEHIEEIHQMGLGGDFAVSTSPVASQHGRLWGTIHVARDITERRRVERLYAVLSSVNETIVRADNETALCRDVCHIVADGGDFPLVWIGLVTGRQVRPVASSGSGDSYLDNIQVEVDGPLGSGPTGSCIREGRSVINDDFDTNPTTKQWRGAALNHGFRASAAFPLHLDGKTVGALTLYAARPGAFDRDQVRLLEALGADLSYALEALHRQRLRAQAETALRKSEQSLRESDQRKSEFLAVLSHELRNPLAPIRNSLFVLEHATPNGEQARRAQTVINRQVGHLSRLVDDLLDLTRISRGKIRLEREVLELNDLIGKTLEDNRSLFERSEVRLETKLATEPLYVNADATRLAQVVGNLLQNAAKFTPRGGRTTVESSADRTRQQAVVSVSDTGIGMAAEVRARLFEPFVQADTTLDRSQGGLGLGLALVKGLVQMHGGTVCAQSDGVGKGAQLVVRLPLALQAAAVAQPGQGRAHCVSRRVLIIEDNVDAADSLSEVLALENHEVAVAYNGPDGLAKARELKPEVVLCDIGLPGMDGYEVARRFRSDETLRGAFLIALSGYAQPEDLQRAREAGFDEHLAKPPSFEKLGRLLARLAPSSSAAEQKQN